MSALITNDIFFHIVYFCLVYWPEEQAASVVGKNAIVSPTDVTVGCDAQVRVGKKVYSGKISAIGKFLIVVLVTSLLVMLLSNKDYTLVVIHACSVHRHTLVPYIGTQAQMCDLEEKYLHGTYTPLSETEENQPPAKKAKGGSGKENAKSKGRAQKTVKGGNRKESAKSKGRTQKTSTKKAKSMVTLKHYKYL